MIARLGAFMLRLGLAFMLLSAPGAAAQNVHPLNKDVADIMRQWGIPGLAIAVVQDGQVVFSAGYGLAEVGHGQAVDADTVFGIGSMTKSFTAVAAALMVDAGKMAWDQPVAEVLPGFQLSDPWITAHATLRDVAAHRVGIDGDGPWLTQSWDTNETLERSRYLKPVAPFRSFLYSNTGTLTLAKAAEAVSGQTWDAIVQQRIFTPLGMTRSDTGEFAFVRAQDLATCWLCQSPPGAARGHAALKPGWDNVAAPHGLRQDPPVPPGEAREVEVWPWRYEGSIAPAGTINSTVHDMAQWLLFHLNAGKVNENQLLAAPQFKEIHSFNTVAETSAWAEGDAATPAATADWLNGMGFGWQAKIYRGHRASTHSGGQPGFGSIMWLVHDARLGVVVLNNLDYRHSRGHLAVARLFVDHYLKLPPIDWATHYKAGWKPSYESRRVELPKNPPLLTKIQRHALVGNYANDVMGAAEISLQGRGAAVKFGQDAWADLVPVSGDQFIAVFRSSEKWRMLLDLTRDIKGEISGFVLDRHGDMQGGYAFQRQTDGRP